MKHSIYVADWQSTKKMIRSIRETVFIQEQGVPECLEWDEHDNACVHFLASKKGENIATARLLESGQIGRIAVLKQHRRQGIGSDLLDYILRYSKKLGMEFTFVHAQEPAIQFYLNKGFKVNGEIFLEANIRHQKMERHI